MNQVGQFRGRGGLRATSNAARMAYQAAKYAYKNRDTLKKAVRKVFPNKKRKLQGPNRRLGYQSRQGTATRVASDPASTGNELTVYRSNVGRYPALKPNRLLKLMQAGMTSTILRAQGITNFDTNVGFYPLANREDNNVVIASRLVNMPIHIWDLTTFPNISSQVLAGYGAYWSSSGTGASVITYALETQTPDGSTVGNYYHPESSSGVQETAARPRPFAAKACHEWSQIKLNLYGARKRGTTFFIDFVRVKNELSHPIAADGANRSKKELFRTLQSPLIFSNLQQHNTKNLNQMQYVKRYKFYVPGGSADDLDLIGKIKEVKIFLKQGNVYKMDWESADNQDALPHAQADGSDYTDHAGPQDHPYHGSRLMMIIRAFSPERRVVTNFTSSTTPADALTEPSYDLVIRNKWTLPN